MNVSGELQALGALTNPPSQTAADEWLTSYWNETFTIGRQTFNAILTTHRNVWKNHHYTGCHRRNGPNFGRVFLMLNYTDMTQNTYIQS